SACCIRSSPSMNRCIAKPQSPKLRDSKADAPRAESPAPKSQAVSTQPGPLRDLAGELSDSPSWEMGWTPLTVQRDGRTRYHSGDIARVVDAVPDLAVGRP